LNWCWKNIANSFGYFFFGLGLVLLVLIIYAMVFLSREFCLTCRVPSKSNFHWDVRGSFAKAFGNWRRKHKLPLKKVARDLGVSIGTISMWESGKRFPTGGNFERLVEYTGLPPCKLFCVMADQCVPADCLLAMGHSPSKPD